MKVALFEIYEKRRVVALRYVSGDHLSFQDLDDLSNYIVQLIADKKAMQPKTEAKQNEGLS